jgi:hypothetical protein
MKKVYLISACVLTLFAVIISCSKSKEDTSSQCEGVPKNFSTDVNPIIQTFCNQANCHNTNSVNGPGALTTYAEIFSARDKIRAQVAAGLMPQNTTLSKTQINTIICWIDSGAPNN